MAGQQPQSGVDCANQLSGEDSGAVGLLTGANGGRCCGPLQLGRSRGPVLRESPGFAQLLTK